MMPFRIGPLALTLLYFLLLHPFPAAAIVYGKDGRHDPFDAPHLLRQAASTLALFRGEGMRFSGGSAFLPLWHYGEANNICPDQPFYDQPSGAFCSGSLIAPNLVLTAGHCLEDHAACWNTAFVFDYAVYGPGMVPAAVRESSVYHCRDFRSVNAGGFDWALIRLDRPVTDREPLPVNTARDIAPGTPLAVIGHPDGLPVKITVGGSVRALYPDGDFVADVDTFHGNSGSAVFNEATGAIEGILVNGDRDYYYRDRLREGPCNSINRCAEGGCSGETITAVWRVFPAIQEVLSGGFLAGD